MEVLRVVVVVVVVPLLLHVVEFATCAVSCPGSVDDEAPSAVKQETAPTPSGRVASCRLDALLVHALRLRSAGGEELDVVRREGRGSDIGVFSSTNQIKKDRVLGIAKWTLERIPT